MNYSKKIDHTLLANDCVASQVLQLLQEAKQYSFKAICVHPYWLNLAQQFRKENNTHFKICVVAGFPLGTQSIKTKQQEIKELVQMGVDEIDFVINLTALKNNDLSLLRQEIICLSEECKTVTSKVIVESGILSPLELIDVIHIVNDSSTNFIKTSTGMHKVGARVGDIETIMKYKRDTLMVKASGGIRDFSTFKTYLDLGVDRIGCSNSVNIIKEGLLK